MLIEFSFIVVFCYIETTFHLLSKKAVMINKIKCMCQCAKSNVLTKYVSSNKYNHVVSNDKDFSILHLSIDCKNDTQDLSIFVISFKVELFFDSHLHQMVEEIFLR